MFLLVFINHFIYNSVDSLSEDVLVEQVRSDVTLVNVSREGARVVMLQRCDPLTRLVSIVLGPHDLNNVRVQRRAVVANMGTFVHQTSHEEICRQLRWSLVSLR